MHVVHGLLQDFHRKLEIEKVERRHSDSQALQLLEEVREQGKIAQQLREGEAKYVHVCSVGGELY